MKKLHTTPDLVFIQHLKLLLESKGIKLVLKNEHISGLQGGIPAQDAWPELWVEDEKSFEDAKLVLEKILTAKDDASLESAWFCKSCKETVEPQFSDCWNCGQAKQGST